MKNLKNDNENDNEFFITISFVNDFRSSSYDSLIKITSSTSLNNSKEKIILKQKKKNIMSSSLHLTFNLWFKKSENFKADYARFKKILQISKSSAKNITFDFENFIHILFKKLNTLKRQMRRHISLLQLMRKIIKITIKKLFSLTKK